MSYQPMHAGAGRNGPAPQINGFAASNGSSAPVIPHGITPWGGVDEAHPFEWLSNPDQLPPQYLIILACCMLGVFTLLNIPRVIARIASSNQGGEAFNGAYLSTKPPAPSPVVGGGIALMQTPITPKTGTFSIRDGEGSPSYPSSVYQTPTTATPLRSFARGYPSPSTDKLVRRTDPPRYVPGLSAVIPYSGLLGITVPWIGYTIGQSLLCACWATFLFVGIFYQNDIVTHNVRAGFVAMHMLPVVFALGTKVNVIGHLVGLGYEKLNFLHRFIGRAIFVASTFHAAAYFVKWAKKGGAAYIAEASMMPFITAGITAWAAFAFIGITSIPIIRRRMYGLFWISHWIGIVTAFVALSFHKPYCGLIATIAMGIYAKDLILRFVLKTRVVPGRLIALPAPASDPSAGSTQIILPLRSGWRAGQHVFVRIPALKEVGGMAWLENHPFTIASAEGSDMVLVAKKAGGWTRDLYDYASKGGIVNLNASEKSIADESQVDLGYDGEKRDIVSVENAIQVDGRVCRVMVEGPYGGPCSLIFSNFAGIMLIAGGSGITYVLSMFEDLVKKSSEGHVRSSSMHIVWICKTLEDAAPLLGHIHELSARAYPTTIQPRITIYLSRSPCNDAYLEETIDIIPRRPDLPKIVQEAISRTRGEMLSGSVNGGGMVVGVCGPKRLIEGVKLAGRKVSWKDKRDIGGLTVHTETFGW
ncbi:hypothetical protein IAT40_001200 [Kwoniella sp. CBS 6097]